MKQPRMLCSERGQVMPLVVVTLFAIFAIMALVIDGGVLFAERRNLQGLADSAARAGAMAIDEQRLRESGDVVQLDPAAARAAARSYLEEAGFTGEFDVSATLESVQVRARQSLRPIFISIVGIKNIEAEASATAGPRTGPGG